MSISGPTPLPSALEESDLFSEILQFQDAAKYRTALKKARVWEMVPGEILSDPEPLRGSYIVLSGRVDAVGAEEASETRIYGQTTGLRGKVLPQKLVAKQRSVLLEGTAELLKLLLDVPSHLTVEFFSPLIAGLEPIADLPAETLEKVIRESKFRVFKNGEPLLREGEYGSTMFFILDGEAEIELPNVQPSHRPVRGRGDFIGEIAVLAYQPRSATITARGSCLVMECGRSAVAEVRKKSKIFKALVEERYRQNAMLGQLQRTSFFSGLNQSELAAIRDIGTLEHFEPYEPLFYQGAEADALYVVLNGTLHVVQQTPAGPRPIAWVRAGETVGEMALLPEPGELPRRGQTVSALQRVDVIRIPADAFQEIMARHGEVREKLLSMTRQRRVANEQTRDDTSRAARLGWMMETQHVAGNWVLAVRMDDCIRCNNCVTACETVHDDGLNRFFWDNMRQDERVMPQVRLSHSCQHCEFALCMEVCPTNAIEREPGTGGVFIEYDRCIRCGKCADPSQGCPYGSINIVPADQVTRDQPRTWLQELVQLFRKPAPAETSDAKSGKNYPVKCDLCHNQPYQACVQHCPTGAVFRVDGDLRFGEALAQPAPLPFGANCPSEEHWELYLHPEWSQPPVATRPAELKVTINGQRSNSRILVRKPERGVSDVKLNFFMVADDAVRIGGGGPTRQLFLPVQAPEGHTSYAVTCRTPGSQTFSIAVYQGGLFLGHTTVAAEFGKLEKPAAPEKPATGEKPPTGEKPLAAAKAARPAPAARPTAAPRPEPTGPEGV